MNILNIISIIIGVAALVLAIVGLILGILNWIVVVVAIIGALFGAFSKNKAGLILNVLVIVLAGLRLFAGGGCL